MKKVLNYFILVMVLVSLSNTCLWAQDPLIHDVIERSKTRVVRIEIFNRFGEVITWGSGFFIAQGEVLTCAHVIEGAYSVQVRSDFYFYDDIVVLKMDVDEDLALLCLDNSDYDLDYNLKHEDYLNLGGEEETKWGQPIITIGYPAHRRFAFDGIIIESESENRVSFEGNDQSFISISGMSGGPVLNLKGEVIGIISHSDYGPDIKSIKKFLEKPDDPHQLPEAGSAVWWARAAFAAWEVIKVIPEVLYDVLIDPIFGRGWLKGFVILVLMGALVGWGIVRFSQRRWTRRKREDKK